MVAKVRRAPAALTIEQRAELLAEGARVGRVGVYVWDLLEKSVVWSDEIFEILGLQPSDGEVDSTAFVDAAHPDDRARIAAARDEAPTGTMEPVEHRIVLPDGRIRFVRSTASIERGQSGAPCRVIGCVIDITDVRQAETRAEMWLRALERSERIGGIGTFIVVPSTFELQWSPGLYRIQGVDPSEPASAELGARLVHADDRERNADWFRNIVVKGDGPAYEGRSVRPDGSERQSVTHASRIVLGDGVERILGTTIDVTERAALEERLRHAAKMEAVATLAAGVAHDFNNYLAVIGANLEQFARDLPGSRSASVAEARYAFEQCASLTRQLLAFARRQPTLGRRVDLRSVVTGAARMLRSMLGDRIALSIELPSDPMPVEIDAGAFEQALLNLAANARDATGGSGKISVRVAVARADAAGGEGARQFARIEFEDDGEGIAPEHLPRIFEPYFTTKGAGAGTGLGLASVDGAVAQMGGTVRVRTERGVGTTFTIELPLAEGPLAGAPPSVVTTPRGGCTVLVVDDQPEVRRTIARVLEAEGYRALQAADGVEALETIESEEHIDLVVSDVVMPRMSGSELASALEQRKPKLPVLLMTGYADAAQLGREREVISKPFAIADLLASVAKALV